MRRARAFAPLQASTHCTDYCYLVYRDPQGFTQGKTWSWYFDQAPAADDQANDDLIRQLSGLDKLLAILMSEAALPGTVAVALCYLLQVRPFAFAELSKGAVTTGALCALPTILLDIYLLGIRPRQLIQARQGKDAGGAEEVDVAHSHKEVNLEETLKPKDSLVCALFLRRSASQSQFSVCRLHPTMNTI